VIKVPDVTWQYRLSDAGFLWLPAVTGDVSFCWGDSVSGWQLCWVGSMTGGQLVGLAA